MIEPDLEVEVQERLLAVFDFDGTLTRHDSFVPFLKFAFGQRTFSRRMAGMVLPSLGFLARRVSRDELKARLIKAFLSGVEVEWVQQQAEAFCEAWWDRLMRPAALESVAAEIDKGAIVTLCSASPEIVLQPFANRLKVELIGTNLEIIDGKLTGLIAGSNCRRDSKVARLEGVYGPLNQFRVRAWGDTSGDHELLAAAQDAHWRHFHPSWRRGRYKGPVNAKLHNRDGVDEPSR
ncbi:HAD-IB family hydrolase [Pseudomonas syringae]|nr:HAD-IB family hydrolase [Pseudomonas syringae]MBD8573603.1 HAD-IB family hydrolase [Pseudomonas syringae]MBD8789944.1 HAD-IB family hydrolase [Pseudomonas syringae]MBD8799919.1 HAD-IB family hydrolase [Pseudomonas syringae]MBD8811085.1 HAD-IB family hydrolase [Pseudomonas syringae]